MKKLILVFMILTGIALAAAAQDNPNSSDEVVSTEQQQDEKVQILSDDLPEAVKKSLDAQDYKGWIVNAAYHDKKNDRYIIELRNGSETKLVKFNRDGSKIDD